MSGMPLTAERIYSSAETLNETFDPFALRKVPTGIVLATGWTCPTGGTGPCPHAYIAGPSLLVLAAGAVLLLLGIVLIAVGGKPSTG